MTPEQLKALFDANGILIVFGWGLLVKYLPWLKNLPNQLIGWTGAALYIITKFFSPREAEAAGFDPSYLPELVGVLLGAFTSAAWARSLYEGFGRPIMEAIFPKTKSVPEESKPAAHKKSPSYLKRNP